VQYILGNTVKWSVKREVVFSEEVIRKLVFNGAQRRWKMEDVQRKSYERVE